MYYPSPASTGHGTCATTTCSTRSITASTGSRSRWCSDAPPKTVCNPLRPGCVRFLTPDHDVLDAVVVRHAIRRSTVDSLRPTAPQRPAERLTATTHSRLPITASHQPSRLTHE